MMKKNDKLHVRKVLFVSKLALTILLGCMVIKTVLLPKQLEKSLSPAPALSRDKALADKTMDSQDLSLADYAEIVERNPFVIPGLSTDDSEQALQTDSISLRPTVSEELGLALFGTVSGNPVVARAIIKDLKTGLIDQYKIGQIVGGARIESIEIDAVVLAHNGERKILKFNYEWSGSYSNTNTQAPSSQITNESSTLKTEMSSQKTGTDTQTNIGYVEAILSKADLKPYVVDNQIEGLKITGLENIRQVKALGLKNGDIIRAVNGHSLTSKQKAYQIFKKARSQATISLELLRDKKSKTLSFPIK